MGGGSGIGEASARALAAHGASVVCADLQLEAATQTEASIGSTATALAVDITSTREVSKLFRTFEAEHNRLDIVVTTPGVNVRKPIAEYHDDEFDRVVELNLKGPFRVLREAGRAMSGHTGGSIIAFSSIRLQVVEPGQGVYAATQAGIVQLVRALAAELGPKGVRAGAIAPGVVETPLTRPIKDQPDWYVAYAAKSVLGRWANADEMAGHGLFGFGRVELRDRLSVVCRWGLDGSGWKVRTAASSDSLVSSATASAYQRNRRPERLRVSR